MYRFKINLSSKGRKRIFLFYPKVKSHHVEELSECMRQLKFIAEDYYPSYRILKMTVFVNTNNFSEFNRLKSDLNELIKSNSNLTDFPVLFVAQSPTNDRNIAVEVLALILSSSDYSYDYENSGNVSFSKVGRGENLEIFGNIIDDPQNIRLNPIDKVESVYQQSMRSFEELKNILGKNNLNFQNIVRQWGYIGKITNNELRNSNDENSKMGNYQMFNMARAEYYKDAEWKFGYPAATGIGANVDGCSIEFVAINENPNKLIIPLHNPKQSDAHSYTGKQFSNTLTTIQNEQADTPKFERGKIVISGDLLDLYVSGTAAIIGEDSISGDIREQTRTTLDNITKLCSKENLEEHGLLIEGQLPKFSGVRAYIKYPKDSSLVEEMCREEFSDVPIMCVIADVCREELLVEIEAYLNCNIGKLSINDK